MTRLRIPLLVPVLLVALVIGLACRLSKSDGLAEVKEEIRDKFPDVDHLPIDQFVELESGRKVLLIDAREAREFEVSHLEKAVHSQDPEVIEKLFREGKYDAVVVYCSVGYRSAQMVRRLERLGMSDVYNLEGSIFEWANDGRPVFDSSGPVQKVHPYDETWGKLLHPDRRASLPD